MKRILQKISEISGMDIKKLLTKENMLVLFFGGILIYVIMLPTKPVNTSYREKEHNNMYEQEINEEKVNIEEYSIWTHSKCLACRKEYESIMVESGFGQKVIWNDYRK